MRQCIFALGLVVGWPIFSSHIASAQTKKTAARPKVATKPSKPVIAPKIVFGPPVFLDDEAEESFNLSFIFKKNSSVVPLYFDYQDEKNYYSLEIDSTKTNNITAQFFITQNGNKKLLSAAPVTLGAQSELVLQRRSWSMQLIANDKVVLRAFDSTWSDGKLGSSGSVMSDFRMQPTEKVRFDDDFTRTGQGGDNAWKTQSGKWQLSASSEHINSKNANMSSNPFAFEATSPKGEALTIGGRAFWDSYDARVSVRPFSNGEIGIAAYVKDAKNYLAFKWSSTDSASARRLVQVKNGVETVLASGKGAYFSRQWYEIGLRLSPGYVEALLDGVPVLRTQSEALGQGGIGLWAKDIENAAFDDVKVRSYDFLRPQFAQTGAWKIQNGAWKFDGASATVAGTGIVTIGPKQNQNYRALISMPLNEAGIIAGWQDSKNYTLFRVLNGRAQIVRYNNGVASVLSDSPQKIAAAKDGTARFMLDSINGVVNVSYNGQIVAQSSGSQLTNGKFGLLAKSTKPLSFKEPVLFFPPPPEPIKVAERMENDEYMTGWANPASQWPGVSMQNVQEFWNVGEHFGDVSLQFPWRKSWTGTFEIALRAKPRDFTSGLVLRGKRTASGESVDWSLLQGDKVLVQSTVALADLPDVDTLVGTTLQVALKGNSLLLASSKGPILNYFGINAFAGTNLAVRVKDILVSSERLVSTSDNRDDYTFTGAPTDFYSLSGRWSIFSRWPCYGDWSFFGGEGQNPVLWTKRQYGGDVVVEYYAHPQMILPKEPGYSHPGDLNVTIGGDGKNPSTGYSFVVAGWDNTRSALYRGNKIVAETSDPKAFFASTINHNMLWHRRWILVRAEARAATKDGKNGVMVTLTLDSQKILEFFDDQPLDGWKNGGRVAFWTVDSTMMIARAKIEAQTLGSKSLPIGLVNAQFAEQTLPTGASSAEIAPRAIKADQALSALVSRSGANWLVKNPISGGIFSVALGTNPKPIKSDSEFSFDARLDENVKIDLYAKVNGEWRTFEISGAQQNDALAPTIGKAKSTNGAVAGWKHYSFAIGEALAKEFPELKDMSVEEIRLGAMQGRAYRWIGFEGNSFGDGYEIGSIKWN